MATAKDTTAALRSMVRTVIACLAVAVLALWFIAENI